MKSDSVAPGAHRAGSIGQRTLAMVHSGEHVRIVGVNAGRGMITRLAAMGMSPGVEVRVVSSGHGGPLVVEVRGTRFALGHGMSDKICVAEV